MMLPNFQSTVTDYTVGFVACPSQHLHFLLQLLHSYLSAFFFFVLVSFIIAANFATYVE